MGKKLRPLVAPVEHDPRWLNELVQQLQLLFQTIPNSPASEGWTPSNYTTTRTLNAGTATTADVAAVLCTLIADLKAVGIIA